MIQLYKVSQPNTMQCLLTSVNCKSQYASKTNEKYGGMHKLIQINQVSLFILWKARGVPCVQKQQFVLRCTATALHSLSNCLKTWRIPKMFDLNISAIKSYWTVAFINFFCTLETKGCKFDFFPFSFIFFLKNFTHY